MTPHGVCMKTFVVTFVQLDTGLIFSDEVQEVHEDIAKLTTYEKHGDRLIIMSIHNVGQCKFFSDFGTDPLPPEVKRYLDGMTDGTERDFGELFDDDGNSNEDSSNPELGDDNDNDEDNSDDWKKKL